MLYGCLAISGGGKGIDLENDEKTGLDAGRAGGGGVHGGDGRAGHAGPGGVAGQLPSLPAALDTTYMLDAISCVSALSCVATGGQYQGASPAVVSTDNGVTWRQVAGFPGGGWFSSISCASPKSCWAASSGSADALAGTSDGGAHWSAVTTADPTYADGAVGCLSLDNCVAIADNALRVTTDDGGLRAG